MVSKLLALVVDDSNVIRELMRLTLSQLGFEIYFSATGEQALLDLAQRKYNVIFLDAMLPGIDGYEICKAVKKNKQYRDTPVIMLTSRSSSKDQIRGAMAGVNSYLIKPIDRIKLVDAIQTHLPEFRRTRDDVIKGATILQGVTPSSGA